MKFNTVKHFIPFIHLLQTIIILISHAYANQCPPIEVPCYCAPSIYEPVAIICENAGGIANAVAAIKNARTLVIDSLTIVDTAIDVLPANAFEDFVILRLVLNRNQLSQIDPEAFLGPITYSLAELDLSDNNLQHIPKNGLNTLQNLRKLYLNRNHIAQRIQSDAFATYASRELLVKIELAANHLTDEHLSENVFRSLRTLRELSLETNALTNVPNQALESQRNTLTNLNLGLNQITEIPSGVLNFPQLTSLSLEFNGINVIVPQVFQGVPHLQYLYLSGNKFSVWQSGMFRYLNELRTLGIGETPISVIPSNAFMYTPNLMRLEMSEAAVDTIEIGAFQKAPLLQAIVLNKNRLTRIHSSMFKNLFELYSVDLQGNRLSIVESEAFGSLPSIRHLDISFNQLQTMPSDTFKNSFEPHPDDRRVIYACANPWFCDSQLEWFRRWLRVNLDIDIDKPGCVAVCGPTSSYCPVEGTPLRAIDECPIADKPLAVTGTALSLIGWIILAVILTILTISTCLMALIHYGMSHKRKKEKDREIEDQQRIISSAASLYPLVYSSGGSGTMVGESLRKPKEKVTKTIELDLPEVRNLDDRQNYYI